jgi:hypothetical protein
VISQTLSSEYDEKLLAIQLHICCHVFNEETKGSG